MAKGEVRSINSSILAQLVDSRHRVDPSEAFKVIYKVPPNYPKSLGQRFASNSRSNRDPVGEAGPVLADEPP
ncbi:unnamed protein product [Dibothriocephalus latus]|uniref:Uncharacterized protein n=1 Tax=Dibothriocephalus latus TaxID=60516 RepID=A0A3P7PLU5_DIBLA|nr:unnamed protein product [Dibothriocephalus latus]